MTIWTKCQSYGMYDFRILDCQGHERSCRKYSKFIKLIIQKDCLQERVLGWSELQLDSPVPSFPKTQYASNLFSIFKIDSF